MAERCYPTSEVRVRGLECQAATAQEWPRGTALHLRSGAAGRRHPVSEVRVATGRRYPASEASGGREETPRVRGQGRPGEATLCPRPGPAAGRSLPRPRPGPAAGRSNPRSGGLAGTGGPKGAIPG